MALGDIVQLIYFQTLYYYNIDIIHICHSITNYYILKKTIEQLNIMHFQRFFLNLKLDYIKPFNFSYIDLFYLAYQILFVNL